MLYERGIRRPCNYIRLGLDGIYDAYQVENYAEMISFEKAARKCMGSHVLYEYRRNIIFDPNGEPNGRHAETALLDQMRTDDHFERPESIPAQRDWLTSGSPVNLTQVALVPT